MCYNSTSPFLFLQTYSCLIIGYIQKRVTLSSKRLTVSLKKVDLFAQKGLPFCNLVICYVSFNKAQRNHY